MSIRELKNADPATSGGKASALGTLLRLGFPVPDGFVIPFEDRAAHLGSRSALRGEVSRELLRLVGGPMAVRSSASDEDTPYASSAGQFDSVVGATGIDDVCEAIEACRNSATSRRAADYRRHMNGNETSTPTSMAVLVQTVVEADVSGVMFTPDDDRRDTRIEAAWGLGLSVVGGTLTPDTYAVSGEGRVTTVTGRKHSRIDVDHEGSGLVTTDVADELQRASTLNDHAARRLARMGRRIAEVFGSPQDIEWAVKGDEFWILQSRPITVPLLDVGPIAAVKDGVIRGLPGATGTVSATARIVRRLSDFPNVRRGDIAVCRFTDPSWTPLFTVASGVVTEMGGSLSHAAIVAREFGIPAAVGVANATERIEDGAKITLDGSAGTVTVD